MDKKGKKERGMGNRKSLGKEEMGRGKGE